MDELGDHERRLLDALQADDSPTRVDADRIKERVLLSASVAAAAGIATTTATNLTGASTATAGSVSAPAAAGAVAGAKASATIGTGFFKALAVVGATIGLGGGVYSVVGGKSSDRPIEQPVEQPTELVESHNVKEAAPPEGATAKPDRSLPADALSGQGDDEASGKVQVPSASRTPGGAAPSTLKQEAALLSRAQAALQNGQAQAAIVALTEHRKRFPNGVLSGEREAALSVAYCKGGEIALGRQRAKAFIFNNPKSPMVQRLRAACQLPTK